MTEPVEPARSAATRARSRRRFGALDAILVTHRYLAVAVGLLMTLWCLSGFVMMYQGYPYLTEQERVRGLAPLDLGNCCAAAELPFADDAAAPDVRIEMLLGTPVLRVTTSFGRPVAATGTFDITTGERVPELSLAQVREVAAEYGRGHGIVGAPSVDGPVDTDQWTVQTAPRQQPIYRARYGDAARSEIYVSGASGEVIQDTTRRERVLSWLGAIPHWLYLVELRRNGPLWSAVVIWSSLLGTFLTATGLYVGVARLKRTKSGGWSSPFRGWWYWHHIAGLAFGVLTLTWIFSGLMTMNPWGALAGTGAPQYVATMRGTATWRDVRQFLEAAPASVSGDVAVIATGSFDDRLHAVAVDAGGNRTRLDSAGAEAPLTLEDIERAVARLGLPAEQSLLTQEDSFYYGHKSDAELPVVRVILGDAERTRLYIDPVTGVTRGVDAVSRWSRWLISGLHDLDFAGLRVRPVWDVVVLLLLAGVTGVCVTGTWLAWKRVRLDARRLLRAINRIRSVASTAFMNGLRQR
jgi:hypothetical protein